MKISRSVQESWGVLASGMQEGMRGGDRHGYGDCSDSLPSSSASEDAIEMPEQYVSTERLQSAVSLLLEGLGEDVLREGLRDTPKVCTLLSRLTQGNNEAELSHDLSVYAAKASHLTFHHHDTGTTRDRHHVVKGSSLFLQA